MSEPVKVDTHIEASIQLDDTPEQSMTSTTAWPLLICSIGNPGSIYANTLHSTGHYIVQRLAERLNAPSFEKSRKHGNGLLTRLIGTQDVEWGLWQSPAYMNDSGPSVKAAYREWLRDLPTSKLVIIHDQLEKPLGHVSLKTGPKDSHKGHNGLKSIKAVLGDIQTCRIGVGIGRPESRDPSVVSQHVLRKMTQNEKLQMHDSLDKIINTLQHIGKLKELHPK